MTFSLLDNPFARLGADLWTNAEDLAERASAEGTAQAAADLHALTALRTRVTAEVGFLPGVGGETTAVLDAVREGRTPTAPLSGQARANLAAHLCAAGKGDLAALVDAQVERGSPSLLQVLADDRRRAGLPAPQPAVVEAAQDEIAERHGQTLVSACLRGPSAGERLAELVRRTDASPAAAAFLRRATTVWARETAGTLASADEATARAESLLSRERTSGAAETFVEAASAWMSLTAPERLIDAQSGLDHEPSAVKARRWRGLAQRLAGEGAEAIALTLSEALATGFADLPGMATLLRRDRDGYAGVLRDRALSAAFQPLQALVARLGAAPAALAETLAGGGFGPGSSGDAGELWRAFAAAREAAPESERPWMIVEPLVGRLDPGQPAAALALVQGLIAAAEVAGKAETTERLGPQERALARKVGLARLQGLVGSWRTAAPALKQLKAVMLLADDPALKQQLAATQQRLERRVAAMSAAAFVLLAVVGLSAVAGLRGLLAPPTSTTAASPTQATDPVPTLPTAPTSPPPGESVAQGLIPPSQASSVPGVTPPTFPTESAPAPAPVAPAVDPGPAVPPPPQPLTFDPTTPPESQPADDVHVFSMPELRWCKFTEVRLMAIRPDVPTGKKEAFNRYAQPWDETCRDVEVHRADAARVGRELARYHGALVAQSRQMLRRLLAE